MQANGPPSPDIPDGEKDLLTPATVRIGVTGHRRLGDEQLLRASVQGVLTRLEHMLSHTPHTFVVVSPLAEGADRLAVTTVLAWPAVDKSHEPALEVALPLAEADYLRDFDTKESAAEFQALKARAKSVPMLDPVSPREAAYEQVGRWVVHNCDILIAIWNGQPAAGRGGTAEIVEYARGVGRTIFWIDSESGELTEERHDDGTLEFLEHLDTHNAEGLQASSQP